MKIQSSKAGIGTGRAGLQAASGLFSSAGLFQKGVKSFDPNDLDPYLLFDARTSMIGTLENPTLDLDPANPETLDVITATRAGNATYTDADGLIQAASPNTTRVDYVQGEELTPTVFQRVGYTDFSSGWIQGGLTISNGAGLSGEVSKVVENDDAGSGNAFYFNVPTVEGQTYTGGFWVRRISGSGFLALYHTFSPTGSQKMITHEVTSEWTFVSAQFLGRIGGGSVRFGVRVYYTSGDSVEIAMPQVEEGTTASSFVANTTGSPKFITGATYGPRVPMILVEPSSENLITQTDFSAGWSLRGSATVEQTTEPTPLPAQTALRLQSNGGISDRYQAPSGYPSGVSTASVYIKWDGVDTRFRIERAISNSRADFNVTQAGVTHYSNTADGYSIEEHGDGWWRVSNTMTNPTWVQLYADVEDGDGSILMALPQHEVGTVPTSFIPASGSAVTRAADDLVISGSDFTDFYNDTEGTVYVEAASRKVNVYPRVFKINGALGSEYFEVALNSTTVRCRYDNATNQVDLYSGNVSDNTFNKIAVSYRVNDFLLSVDGGASLPDTNASLFSATSMRIGNSGSSTRLNGHIKRLIYWPLHSDSL